jgi:hypothetical protein
MNKHSHENDHQHSDRRGHEDGHGTKHEHRSPGWRPHRDWRVWAVVLMLVAMAVYVLSLDDSIWPGGVGPAVPAPADAP